MKIAQLSNDGGVIIEFNEQRFCLPEISCVETLSDPGIDLREHPARALALFVEQPRQAGGGAELP